MATRTIYCDESGFTGYNLLDRHQPVFAIASANIQEEQAEDILRSSFPNYKAAEFKFSNIWSTRNKVGLLKFAAHIPKFEELLFIYMIDKGFATLTKAVDFLIEPYITDTGYDFYDEGFCWKYCNYIYFGLTNYAPPELLESLLRNYQSFSRNPSPETLARLQLQLGLMATSAEARVRVFFQQMELGAKLFHKYHNLDTFRGSDELQMTTMLAVVGHWRQRFAEDFAIIHDASSNFLRSRKMWEKITNNDVPKQMHRLGDGSFVEFPLRVRSTTSLDSMKSRSIQFCDLLAGLATRHFSPFTEGDDRRFIDELGFRLITNS